MPPDAFHPAIAATGVGTDGHRLMTAHDVLLQEGEEQRAGVTEARPGDVDTSPGS